MDAAVELHMRALTTTPANDVASFGRDQTHNRDTTTCLPQYDRRAKKIAFMVAESMSDL